MTETATQTSDSAGRADRPQSEPAASSSGDTEDQEYALVSVLYHALQGVQACDQYIIDAGRSGDEELMPFFVESREEQKRRANRAKTLVVARIEPEDEEGADEEE